MELDVRERNIGIIVGELRNMRRARAHTTIDYAQAPTLVWHLGRGDIEVVAMFFNRMMAVEDVEIRAALASLGFGNWEKNIEDRMSDFASYYGEKSSRTVRRWSEQGFRKIADLVIEWSIEEAHDNPLIEVVLRPLGSTIICLDVTCAAQPGVMMFKPEVRTLSETIDWQTQVPIDELEDPIVFEGTCATDLPDNKEALLLNVAWLGNSDAYYQVQVPPGIIGHLTSIIVTKKGCEIRFDPQSD